MMVEKERGIVEGAHFPPLWEVSRGQGGNVEYDPYCMYIDGFGQNLTHCFSSSDIVTPLLEWHRKFNPSPFLEAY